MAAAFITSFILTTEIVRRTFFGGRRPAAATRPVACHGQGEVMWCGKLFWLSFWQHAGFRRRRWLK
ncbi:MAG TPA: hypothetical protein PLM52_07120, partial [Tabrizicola sp.]|nr:hypothetical protein [Tabrizicola sp.]